MWLKNHLTTKILCFIESHTCTFNINKDFSNKGEDGDNKKEENADKKERMKTERSKNFKEKKHFYDSKWSKK